MMCCQKYYVFLIGLSLLGLFSCGSGSQDDLDIEGQLDTISLDTNKSAFSELMKQYSKAIPAPAEFTSFVYNSGLPYRKAMLNLPDQKGRYVTNFKKALNAGIYGADLCYLSLYRKNREMSPYFDVLKDLMTDLHVDRIISFEKYRPFIENPSDSVLNLLSMDFEQVNTYFMEGNKSDLSFLLALGGWVESIYFSATFVNTEDAKLHDAIQEKLVEQKIVFEDFLFMMDARKNDDGFSELYPRMLKLKTSFDQVEVSYQKSSSTSTHEVDGVLMVDDASSSSFVVSRAVLKELVENIQELRAFIVK